MLNSMVSRHALIMSVAGALLAGCGGEGQPPRAAGPVAGAASRILPLAKASDLVYVSNVGNNTVTVYSYQNRKLVGTLTGFSSPAGLCSDAAGDVWITNQGEHDVIEYAHGGTIPIQTLSDGTDQPLGCSVDGKTGNLAVVNADDLAVYAGATGSPTLYTGGDIFGNYACTYDAQGDLLLDGGSYDNPNLVSFAELAAGATQLKEVVLSKHLEWSPPTFVQWDGQFWTVGAPRIDWFKLSGKHGKLEGYTVLAPTSSIAQSWIAAVGIKSKRGNQLVATEDDPYKVEFFDYPAGGKPFANLIDGLSQPYGITVSGVSK